MLIHCGSRVLDKLSKPPSGSQGGIAARFIEILFLEHRNSAFAENRIKNELFSII